MKFKSDYERDLWIKVYVALIKKDSTEMNCVRTADRAVKLFQEREETK